MKNKKQQNSDTLNNGVSTNLSLVEPSKGRKGQKGASVPDQNKKRQKGQASQKDKSSKRQQSQKQEQSKKGSNKRTDNPLDKKQRGTMDKQNANNNIRQQQFGAMNFARMGKLKVIFLGGVGEIGKNMTLFEYGNSIVAIDAGMAFPGADTPGVDVVIPDVTYLVENQHKFKGILLTHGHEDHIGALPFIVARLNKKVDVYGTKLTLALAESKLIEHNVADKVNLVPVGDKSVVAVGDFTAEFIHVSHSIAGSCAICLRTPVGVVLHTGDFKIDYTPLGNEIMNINRIAEIGKEGVLLLMSESTNVEKTGYTLSESTVSETFNKLFQDAKGRRIIVATFASNIDRIGMIMDLAKLYKRKIAISGRSMVKYIETANRVGVLKVDNDMFVDIDKVNGIDDGKLVILSTGSQGEPMSALTRMASGEFNKVQIGTNDTIIISATPIPGNERDVYNVINKLYRLGAVVVYSALQKVHVSGHACQEELKLIYTLVSPKYFIPIHGEYRHLKQHARLVEKLKHKESNIIIPDLCDCVEIDKNTFKVTGQVVGGNVMVDGFGVGDVGNIVLKDRLSLAEEGILVCVLGIDKYTHTVVSGPEVVSRGCFFDEDGNSRIEEVKKVILTEIENQNASSISAIKTVVQRCCKKYFKTQLKRNPMVLPVILEV